MEKSLKYSLTKKLIETRHLSISEGNELPNSYVDKSLIYNIILASLEAYGWFPIHLRPNDIWLGGLIEKGKGTCLIHWQFETGSNARGTRKEAFESMGKAICKYIEEEFGDAIDGIPIQ